jgi:hypothetical protein
MCAHEEQGFSGNSMLSGCLQLGCIQLQMNST